MLEGGKSHTGPPTAHSGGSQTWVAVRITGGPRPPVLDSTGRGPSVCPDGPGPFPGDTNVAGPVDTL